jgi:hypothetical protein
MKNIEDFLKVDRAFLAQTEQLIQMGEPFRKNRNWPPYLKKLQDYGLKYIIIESRSIKYSDVKSVDVRPEQIIDINAEIELLSKPAEVDERFIKPGFMDQGLVAPGHGSC